MKKVLGLIIFLSLAFNIFSGMNASAAGSFYIENYDVDLRLGRDENNFSTLQTTEKIKVNFVSGENHGLERDFIKNYDGHYTDFKLESVVDENGDDLKYHWSGDSLRIGDEDTLVSGQKTYVITYSQKGVTKKYTDTNKDEFYWNAIGTEWDVEIRNASVRINPAENLRANIKSKFWCYRGTKGSNNNCYFNSVGDGVQLANIGALIPGEGVTVAVGFSDGTFAQYQEGKFLGLNSGIWGKIGQFAPFAAVAALFGGLFFGLKKTNDKALRRKEIGSIPTEYLPPKGVSVYQSWYVYDKYETSGSYLTAQILDFAVRGYVDIYDKPKTSMFNQKSFVLKLKNVDQNLQIEEIEILGDIFLTNNLTPGLEMEIGNGVNDKKILIRAIDNAAKLKPRTAEYFQEKGSLVPKVTDQGLNLYRYLKGLEKYITLAETERIRVLQSPETAERILNSEGLNINDNAQLVKLYEKTLPYAVIFGRANEWVQYMDVFYGQGVNNPSWYYGTGNFNASLFIAAFTSATSSASFNSVGGSSGGGSVGRGGGGSW